jgi:lipopolysaccharide/colanic/teichoic acid biosynthesis glycosyltransferase
MNWWAKRVFDIIVSSFVLLLLSPVFTLIALAIKRDSPGPVFYRGRRIGRNGKVFRILKFRTMYEDAKSYTGPKVTAHDDDRITPLGGWLRDTKINEFPQFWNVLKGDMSIVGPRPEDPDIANTWPRDAWMEILSVRPGISSPASVQYHNEEAILSADTLFQKYMMEVGPDKMRLDQLYVRYRSFLLDLDVILWTALIMFPMVGGEEVPEEVLFIGPISKLFRRYVNWFTRDILTTFIAMAISGVIWRLVAPLDVGWPKAIAVALGFSLLFSSTGALMGVNRISWKKATFADAVDMLPAWAIASVIAVALNWYFRIFPPVMMLFASGLSLAGFVFTRYRSRIVRAVLNRMVRTRTNTSRERVLIIGAGPTAHYISTLLRHPANSGKYMLVGFIHSDIFYQGLRIYGAPVLGNIKDIPTVLQKNDVGIIILADHRVYNDNYQNIAEMCAGSTARLLVMPDVLYTLNNMVKYGRLSSKPEKPLNLPATGPLGTSSAFLCKRCLATYAPMKVNAMIDEVDQALANGDVQAARRWIEKIRRTNDFEGMK